MRIITGQGIDIHYAGTAPRNARTFQNSIPNLLLHAVRRCALLVHNTVKRGQAFSGTTCRASAVIREGKRGNGLPEINRTIYDRSIQRETYPQLRVLRQFQGCHGHA
ncbi:hypothetical protein Q4463_09805 [Bacteroides caccae]|uniref:Uncharacterized protein n=1 Tax=Bacteroides caccae TaxID=47678 RepID=A0AAW7WLB9_9BACE|nr:hypothetical protein [Bacteroides caccae]MDO6328031.1 hypothetical protein [Bacteroides caccae]MDO6340393.1 hypothetical protein [Bacteroides caccae]MDO6357443.1 hypothetical protein [Bacteroides caccae]